MSANSAELVVISTTSMKEALMELTPMFERASGRKVNMTYGGGSALTKQIAGGLNADLFMGPDEFAQPLMKQGALAEGSRVALALSQTALAVRAGAVRLDISTPEKLKSVLLAAKTISYSAGASGILFVKILEQLGIKDAVDAKRVAARPGELIGEVVARGEAEIGVQQVSELLPVRGIQMLDALPEEFRQPIIYGATFFTMSSQREAAQAFISFLQSEPAKANLRKHGLEPPR